MRVLAQAALPGPAMPGGNSACRAQADVILGSPGFARSHRMQRLLRFLVDETLAGRASSLKEYTIAVGVFDRPPSFDPGSSALVRVEAGRLRRLLEEYRRDHGHDDDIEVFVPKGSYVPVFRLSPLSADMHGSAAASKRRPVTIAACKGVGGQISPGLLAACKMVAEQTGCRLETKRCGTIALYFGWPVSMSDSPGRALTETLGILSSTEGTLGIHIGVATGEVEADGKSPDIETWDIVDQVLDLAERLATRAPNDAILMSEATRRATGAPSTLLRPAWSNHWAG